MSPAAVRIDRSSSSRVVAPSASAEIVRVGDAHGVDAEQPLGGAGDRVHDLVDVDGLERTAALLDPHAAGRRLRPGRRYRRLRGVGQRRCGAGPFCSSGCGLGGCGIVVDHCHRGFSCSLIASSSGLLELVWNRSRNCCRPPDVVAIPRRWHHMSWQRVRNYSSETTAVSTVSSRNGQLACTTA